VAWPGALAAGRAALAARSFARADSVFAAFVQTHPGTPAAIEAGYWRAVVALDPLNATSSTAAALAALDAYAAADPARPHAEEAAALRGLAGLVDSLRLALGYERSAAAAGAAAAAAARAALVPRDTLRARDDELARLRAELEAVRAELGRVRRRLAAPGAGARGGP
jgi:outer membrane protein assembly factor BamD (BamD/ComL family)